MLKDKIHGFPGEDSSFFNIKFITSNKHKFIEARQIFNKYGINLEWIPIHTTELQSNYIEEITIHKVISLREIIDPIFIVEDSALHINALNGFPGPYAAYVYDTLGLQQILNLMEGVSNRKAKFIASGALVLDRNIFKIFKGVLKGEISLEIKGNLGFGYDPIFIPEGMEYTLAELSLSEKNNISHRGKLFRSICNFLMSLREGNIRRQ